MKKVKFVYNPLSGESVITEMLDQIVAVYQRQGFQIVPYRLTFDGNPDAEVLDGVDDTWHHILIAGGDGTVNYVVNLLKKNNLDVPISVLPTGTANDFAMLLGIPNDIIRACKRILAGQVRPIDIGRVNGQYFVNIFSCGLFAEVSQRTPTFFKNTFGRMAYYFGGLGEISRIHRMHLKITSDGGDFEGSSLIFFVFNGRTAGNLPIGYLSEIDDGYLDVLIVKGDNPIENMRTVFHYLARATGEYPPGMVHIRCTRLTATSDSARSTDVDGQSGPSFPIEITCHRGAQRVIFPAPAKTRL